MKKSIFALISTATIVGLLLMMTAASTLVPALAADEGGPSSTFVADVSFDWKLGETSALDTYAWSMTTDPAQTPNMSEARVRIMNEKGHIHCDTAFAPGANTPNKSTMTGTVWRRPDDEDRDHMRATFYVEEPSGVSLGGLSWLEPMSSDILWLEFVEFVLYPLGIGDGPPGESANGGQLRTKTETSAAPLSMTNGVMAVEWSSHDSPAFVTIHGATIDPDTHEIEASGCVPTLWEPSEAPSRIELQVFDYSDYLRGWSHLIVVWDFRGDGSSVGVKLDQ